MEWFRALLTEKARSFQIVVFTCRPGDYLAPPNGAGRNPIRETSLPRARESEETVAYSLDTVLAMLRVVPEPSRSVVAIAAFAGLRRGEIEGLQWESYDGDSLNVTRAMWQGIEGTTKSKNRGVGFL
jgi:integrase